MYTAEIDSAVVQYAHWGDWLSIVMHTAEFLRFCVFLTWRCYLHCGEWLSGVMHTGEIDSPVWCIPRSFLYRFCVFLTPWVDAHCGDVLSSTYDEHRRVWLGNGIHTTEILQNSHKSAKSKRIKKHFSLFVKCPDGVESWNNRGQKSGDTLPLKEESRLYSILYCIM